MRAVLFALLLPCAVSAQQDAPAPPPPDPATGSAAPVSTTLLDDRAPAEDAREDAPLPEKILEPPPPEAAPTVSIRSDGEDVVEEYRQNGRIYMVKVRPPRGVPYTLLDTNGDGRLDADDSDGPVRPVYYTIYEWN